MPMLRKSLNSLSKLQFHNTYKLDKVLNFFQLKHIEEGRTLMIHINNPNNIFNTYFNVSAVKFMNE